MSIYSVDVISGSFNTSGEMLDMDFEKEVHDSKGDWEISFEDVDPEYSGSARLRKVNGVLEVLEEVIKECCPTCGTKKVFQVWTPWE